MPQRSQIKVKTTAGSLYPLVFPSLKDAQVFYDWLLNFPCAAADLNNPIKIGNYTLIASEAGDDNHPLTKALILTNGNITSPLPYYK